ncbi:hypothetical protein D3C79_362130 [compost metagenome]
MKMKIAVKIFLIVSIGSYFEVSALNKHPIDNQQMINCKIDTLTSFPSGAVLQYQKTIVHMNSFFYLNANTKNGILKLKEQSYRITPHEVSDLKTIFKSGLKTEFSFNAEQESYNRIHQKRTRTKHFKPAVHLEFINTIRNIDAFTYWQWK